MLIRIGFDIELSISTPMALVYLLHVHPSRQHDLQTPENFNVSPPVEESPPVADCPPVL